jgi:hypothetical protein
METRLVVVLQFMLHSALQNGDAFPGDPIHIDEF